MNLTIRERFSVVTIYIVLILGIGNYFSNDWRFIVDTDSDLNPVLIATGLAMILSAYITEPFFSKPVDVVTRWVAIFLFLIGLNSKQCISLYTYWLFACGFFIFSSVILIFLHGIRKHERQQRIAVDIICKLSRPEIIFSILYFDVVISLFRYKPEEYPVLIGFGFLLAINKPIIWFVKFVTKQYENIITNADGSKFIGHIIGHDSTDLYKVELSTDNNFRRVDLIGKLVYLENISNGVAGIVLSERTLLGKKWIEVLSLRDSAGNLLLFNIKSLLPLSGEKSIFSKTNAVYLLDRDTLEDEINSLVENHPVILQFNQFIGSVWQGSTINKIRFNKLFSDQLQINRGIGEGSIIQTQIAGEQVLYQITY